MTLRKGLPAKKASVDADDTRYDYRNLVVCNADGSPRGGVTSPLGVNLVTPTATMNSTVAAFSAVAVRDGGVVLLANDGPVNVLHDPAPTSNSRYDVVYAKQNDSSSTVTTPDANDVAVLGIAKGASTLPLTKPSIPIGAVELATVLIPAGATATNSGGVVITQTAQFTAAPGGAVPFRAKSDMDAWTTAATGQLANVFADSTSSGLNNGVWRFNGTVWRFYGVGEWVTYTPALTNLTAGNGTLTCLARREGQNIHVRFGLTFGSTSAMGTIPQISLPAPASIRHPYEYFGEATGLDISANTPYLMAVVAANASTSTAQIVPVNSGAIASTVNAGAPFTWTATGGSDSLSFDAIYLAA